MTNVAVIYYSSTGNVHGLAEAVAEGAAKAGAEVRLRRVEETAPDEAVAGNPAWAQHLQNVADVETVTVDDVLWADAVVFGTPTRYGNVSAQLKSFIDTLGPQWQRGELANKVYSGFTSASTAHGGHETTLTALYNTVTHFGGIIVPPGYTDPIMFASGSPYGATHVSGQGANPLGDVQMDTARFQGGRVAKVAALLAGADLAV
jgi:NAD(P)H dehydrogenase (quinone)